jgi:DNA (cytosine-5)-methyltransferase 1
MTLNTVLAHHADTSSRNEYLAILDDAWQKHLAPRQDNAPTVISAFAGCGGSSLGYSFAGYRELLAVEWDDNAVETFKLNFSDVPVYHGDIAKLSVEQVLEMTGLKPGELDVFDGSPPCQGFSTAGKRVMDDPRNQLFREYVRLLQGLQPKVFVMENVSGMVKGKMKLVFVEILKELKACGYRVKACLLNAKFFNVPQSRERMIFIGVRDDLAIEPSHPKAVSQPTAIGQAVVGADVSGCPPFNDKYAQLWDLVPRGGNASDVIGTGYSNCLKPNPNRPAPTLPKTQTGRGFATIAHWDEKRALSIGEAKRAGSFPDQFQFIGEYSERWARIGNSVPPLLMNAIAGHIRREILDT